MDTQGPPSTVSKRWAELIEDCSETGSAYQSNDWEVVIVDSGDVSTITNEPIGLDVLAPSEQVEELESVTQSVLFDTSHVYRADEQHIRFYMIIVESHTSNVAVIIPAFIEHSDLHELELLAAEDGHMYTHIRPLSDDTRVTFAHEDYSIFFES